MVTTENTELKIVEAATSVFVHKGFDGARMQEIADRAGINKAMVHYYFRTKQKLFERVFESVFEIVAARISSSLEMSESIDELLDNITGIYFSVLAEKPYIPDFVIHELNRNPELIVHLIKTRGINKEKLSRVIISETETRNLKPFDPVQIIVNVLALTIFPFVASSIIKGFIFEGNTEEYDKFVKERRQHIIDFVKSAIFKD
jgi:AcrR family transcriptional regulator